MADLNVSQIVATTLRLRAPAVADNVTNNNALLYQMKKRGKMKLFDGGRTLFQPLMYQDTGNFKWYSGYDTLDISIRSVIDGAEYAIKFASTTVSMSGEEMVKNSGQAAVVNLLEGKIDAATSGLENGIAQGMYADGTGSGGKEIGGAQLVIADTPTNTVGGIDGNTWSFWRNISYDATTDGGAAASTANIVTYMNNVFNQLVRGTDRPDIIIADTNYYSLYEGALQLQQRFTSDEMASAGFTNLAYKGNVPVVLDGGVYNAQTGYTGCPTNHMYFANSKYYNFYTYRGRQFEALGGERMSINQDATVRVMGWAGNIVCGNRRLQGVLKD